MSPETLAQAPATPGISVAGCFTSASVPRGTKAAR